MKRQPVEAVLPLSAYTTDPAGATSDRGLFPQCHHCVRTSPGTVRLPGNAATTIAVNRSGHHAADARIDTA